MGEQSRTALNLKVIVSEACAKEFQRALPSLRKELGKQVLLLSEKCSYGVGSNTYRAFKGPKEPSPSKKYEKLKTPPSKAYSAWANKVCKSLDAKALAKQIATVQGFEAWHGSLAESLQKHWKKVQAGESLSLAHKYKLIDLFVKWLSNHNFDCPELTKAFEEHAHCALDSQTLEKINACISYALPIKNPSMGDITTQAAYDFCQQLIAGFARSQGGSSLLFDYHSWKSGGSGKKTEKAKSA